MGLCRHFPNIKQVIIPIFFHIVNRFSTGFAGGFLYYNEKLARGKTPRAGFLFLLYTAFLPRDRLDMCIIVQTQAHILRDIREQHHPDSMTADEVSFAENMQNLLQDAMNFEGSSEEKKAKALLATMSLTLKGRGKNALLRGSYPSYNEGVIGLTGHCLSFYARTGKL